MFFFFGRNSFNLFLLFTLLNLLTPALQGRVAQSDKNYLTITRIYSHKNKKSHGFRFESERKIHYRFIHVPDKEYCRIVLPVNTEVILPQQNSSTIMRISIRKTDKNTLVELNSCGKQQPITLNSKKTGDGTCFSISQISSARFAAKRRFSKSEKTDHKPEIVKIPIKKVAVVAKREKPDAAKTDNNPIQVVKEYVARGLTHFHITKKIRSQPLSMHVAKIDPSFYQLKMVEPRDFGKRKNTLTSMARQLHAIAGINAMYFSKAGEILGFLQINNRVVSSPVYNRATVGQTENGTLIFGYPQFRGEIYSPLWEGGKYFSSVNHRRTGQQVTLFTADYGAKTPIQVLGKEFVVHQNRIIERGVGGMKIPQNGFVLSVGQSRLKEFPEFEPGDPIHFKTFLDREWQNLQFSFSAGPLLLYNGQVIDSGEFEHFRPGFINNRHPRSAIGITQYGSIVLAVVDGRQPGKSVGLNVKEFSEILKKIGVYHAINLDGGGSTALYLKNHVVNNPSGGTERLIANALLILQKPTQTMVSK